MISFILVVNIDDITDDISTTTGNLVVYLKLINKTNDFFAF